MERTDTADAGGVVTAQQLRHANQLHTIQAQLRGDVRRTVLLHVLLALEDVPAQPKVIQCGLALQPRLLHITVKLSTDVTSCGISVV